MGEAWECNSETLCHRENIENSVAGCGDRGYEGWTKVLRRRF